ncbi:MAG: hypothetical protein ACHQ5A_11435, partial [Opitutales bacterium]
RPAPPQEYEFGDPELAERTRQIREEIRRKIEERRGQNQAPPAPEREPWSPTDSPPEAAPPPVVITLPDMVREVMAPPARETETATLSQDARAVQYRATEELERQKLFTQQFQEAATMQQAVDRREIFEQTTVDQAPAARELNRVAVLDDLRDPAALRRAFLLREILGPPVALR